MRSKAVFGESIEAALLRFRRVPEDAGGHHGREREGDDGGKDDGDRQGNRKFAKEAADDVAHEEQRNENGDQRDGQRQDGEADLLGAFEGRLHRRIARLQVAGDVFNHDDGVVDDEAGGDGQGHEREVIEAVAERYITPNVPTSESGTATLGMMVAWRLRKNRKMTRTTRTTVSISSNSTSLMEA